MKCIEYRIYHNVSILDALLPPLQLRHEATLEARNAYNFLHPLQRHRRNVVENDDANEECCHEGCSIHEIAEYRC